MKQCRNLTLVGVRRTLEEDLKLEKKALDVYKGFVTKELDRVSSDVHSKHVYLLSSCGVMLQLALLKESLTVFLLFFRVTGFNFART
jgi:hypothetical protein